MMTSALAGVTMTDSSEHVYIQNGILYFQETAKTYAFSKTIPVVQGGTIAGALTVSNGSFGKGCVIVGAVNTATNQMAGAFLSEAGQYLLQGLADGQYITLAFYIPKDHALDYSTLSPTQFPTKTNLTPITISKSNHVSNINFNIDLSSGLSKSAKDSPIQTSITGLLKATQRCFQSRLGL